MSLKDSYSSPLTTLRRYWASYGGCEALWKSPYFHVGILLALPGAASAPAGWIEHSASIIPDVLGFSLGGYAILLALGSGTFFEKLRKPRSNGRPSVIEGIATSFLHFVIVQMICLISALLAISAKPLVGRFLDFVAREAGASARLVAVSLLGFWGWMLLFYSLTCAIALVFRLFRLVQLAAKS